MADLVLLTLAGVALNSWLPAPPYEAVVLGVGAAFPAGAAWMLAGVASLSAGLGESLGAGVVGRFDRRPPKQRWARWLAGTGRGFYLWAGAFALLPLPITAVRLAALWRRPRPLAFGAAVALGRLPRYLVLLGALRWAAFPG